MSKIITLMLGFELTEKCNLDCRHCLNGDNKNIFITEDIVRRTFDEVKFVDTLYFSGGEVFLAYEQMKMVLDIAKEKNVKINSCSIITNGTIYDERIYNLLEENFKNKFSVSISNDDYHNKSIKRVYKDNINIAHENIKKNLFTPHNIGFKDAEAILIDMGRARKLNVPKADFEVYGYYYDYYENCLLVGPIIYVTAEGYISDGNIEFSLYSEQSLGNIQNNPISDLVVSGGIKINTNDVIDFLYKMKRRMYEYHTRKGDHLRFYNNKLQKFVPQGLDDYYDEISKARELFNEILESETQKPGSIIKKILEYDFSKYPHDLSQIDHD